MQTALTSHFTYQLLIGSSLKAEVNIILHAHCHDHKIVAVFFV